MTKALILERGLRLTSIRPYNVYMVLSDKGSNPRKGIATNQSESLEPFLPFGDKGSNPRKGIAT